MERDEESPVWEARGILRRALPLLPPSHPSGLRRLRMTAQSEGPLNRQECRCHPSPEKASELHKQKSSAGLTAMGRRIYLLPKQASILSHLEVAMAELMRKCDVCSHSKAAHVDGVHCALCRCASERLEMVQDSFVFRSALTPRTGRPGKKR